MLLTALLLLAQAGSPIVPGDCLPPDTSFASGWYAEPEPGPTGRAHSGIITYLLHPDRDRTELSLALGSFRVIRTRIWRQATTQRDTLYFHIRKPTRGDSVLYGKDIRYFVIGAMSSTLAGSQEADSSTELVGEATHLGLLFSVGTSSITEDGDGFRVTSIDDRGIRGWWDGGPSVVPESLAWFCATKVD